MNVREFRKDLSTYLNDADSGKEVRFNRGNKVYELKAIGMSASVHTIKEPVRSVYTPITKKLEAIKIHKVNKAMCKNGHFLNNRGYCDWKGCK